MQRETEDHTSSTLQHLGVKELPSYMACYYQFLFVDRNFQIIVGKRLIFFGLGGCRGVSEPVRIESGHDVYSEEVRCTTHSNWCPYMCNWHF